jgi:excinuclease ABC subunit A
LQPENKLFKQHITMSELLEVKWANTHNLKNVSVDIPKNKLVVITGVSGSGKSSLAFDTIYAEWQRRYLESLSTYARMIISSINEDTKVDEIRWLSPTISINQKTVTANPRSTVWTITEIYDFYRLLFVHIWVQKCPNHPEIILKKDTINDIMSYVNSLIESTKYFILAPVDKKFENVDDLKREILELGFIRYMVDDKVYSIWDPIELNINNKTKINIVIDRLIISKESEKNDNIERRIKDSLDVAYKAGNWLLSIYEVDSKKNKIFSQDAFCPLCHYTLEDLSLSNFSFNSHYWACSTCHWLWMQVAFLEENIINSRLSLNEWAILPWNQHKYYMQILTEVCKKYKIDINTPYMNLSTKEKNIILNWVPESFEIFFTFDDWQKKTFKTRYEWVIPNLDRKYKETDIQNEMSLKKISQYMTEIVCSDCNWFRLKKEYLNVFVWGIHIWELSEMNVKKAIKFFSELKLGENEKKISKSILKNICERLDFLSWVWLDYITVARRANTLSGWESQRIRLATQIGTRLEWIIYILDEPSIGLHPRDNWMLIKNLKKLSEIGNTVIVVEHDEDIMRESDYIIDVWPGAWIHGWNIVFEWTFEEIIKDKNSETWEYLSNKKIVSIKKKDRKIQWYLEIIWASENNLKDVDVKIPLWLLTVVTGVSGSGKSSLILDILSNHLLNTFYSSIHPVWKVKDIKWAEKLDKVIIIDQSPIGRTPHSNVATYTWVFTHIREVFAKSQEALKRWYWPWRFSFNTKWWRCEVCEWSWVKKIEMHFLPDVYVECESCHGSRYNNETLEVRYKGKTISEVLNMDVEEACEFFAAHPKIFKILDVLFSVWLGYIKIWQSAPTLSGWESQRIKLSSELAKRSTTKTIYILDEPTTGLHFSDVQKLLNILDSLVDKWNTVLVIEHNLDLIANADYIIDIWPQWWDEGWKLIYSWKLEWIIKDKNSYTWEALKKYMEHKKIKI